MRYMSFSMTTEPYRRGEKTVTRRLGWKNLKPGDVLMGVEKCQGLKKGEHVKQIHPLRVISNVPEPLADIARLPIRESGIPEVALEGFPSMTPREFVDMFCRGMRVKQCAVVNRIEFEHIWQMPVGEDGSMKFEIGGKTTWRKYD